jgi:hypothetical protein
METGELANASGTVTPRESELPDGENAAEKSSVTRNRPFVAYLDDDDDDDDDDRW